MEWVTTDAPGDSRAAFRAFFMLLSLWRVTWIRLPSRAPAEAYQSVGLGYPLDRQGCKDLG
ncbi:hypothetical protein AA21952_1830 [Acetobacter oeni LMG 21952]|nr:hypothetical protein AA21952_1830 [Acetobacter oeni LMG 21952]